MTSRMLVTYIRNTTVPALAGKNVAATITYTVRRAEQDVNGTSSAVSSRCRASGRTRTAEIAGTLQPNPTTSGRNARPGRPSRAMSRSVTTAARAM